MQGLCWVLIDFLMTQLLQRTDKPGPLLGSCVHQGWSGLLFTVNYLSFVFAPSVCKCWGPAWPVVTLSHQATTVSIVCSS